MAGTLRASRTTVRPKLVVPLVAALFVSPAFAGDPVTPPGEATIYREAALADCERVGTRPMLPGLVDLAVLGAIDEREFDQVLTLFEQARKCFEGRHQVWFVLPVELNSLPELLFLKAHLASLKGHTEGFESVVIEMQAEARLRAASRPRMSMSRVIRCDFVMIETG